IRRVETPVDICAADLAGPGRRAAGCVRTGKVPACKLAHIAVVACHEAVDQRAHLGGLSLPVARYGGIVDDEAEEKVRIQIGGLSEGRFGARVRFGTEVA